MENIVFDRNYELVSEDNSFADAVYKQITAPDGFFASFTKKMDAIPKVIMPEDQANYEYLLERCDQFAQDHHGRIHAVVDYQHFHSEINLYLRMIEFDCEEDIYCIVQSMWTNLAILAGMGLAAFLALFGLVWLVVKAENLNEYLGQFLRS